MSPVSYWTKGPSPEALVATVWPLSPASPTDVASTSCNDSDPRYTGYARRGVYCRAMDMQSVNATELVLSLLADSVKIVLDDRGFVVRVALNNEREVPSALSIIGTAADGAVHRLVPSRGMLAGAHRLKSVRRGVVVDHFLLADVAWAPAHRAPPWALRAHMSPTPQLMDGTLVEMVVWEDCIAVEVWSSRAGKGLGDALGFANVTIHWQIGHTEHVASSADGPESAESVALRLCTDAGGGRGDEDAAPVGMEDSTRLRTVHATQLATSHTTQHQPEATITQGVGPRGNATGHTSDWPMISADASTQPLDAAGEARVELCSVEYVAATGEHRVHLPSVPPRCHYQGGCAPTVDVRVRIRAPAGVRVRLVLARRFPRSGQTHAAGESSTAATIGSEITGLSALWLEGGGGEGVQSAGASSRDAKRGGANDAGHLLLPSGRPLQVSKNWHAAHRDAAGAGGHGHYEGVWWTLNSLIAVPTSGVWAGTCRIHFARVMGADLSTDGGEATPLAAASHAQLSLLGWGHYGMWEQV